MTHREVRAVYLRMQSELAKRLAEIDKKISDEDIVIGLQEINRVIVNECVKDAFAAIDEEFENLDAEVDQDPV